MSSALSLAFRKSTAVHLFHCRVRVAACKWLLPVILAMATFAGQAHAAPISTASLLGEMTALDNMAEFPDPPYTCKQFSSYDPASKSPSQDWFANGDCGKYLRIEDKSDRKEYVMAEMVGPGAIVRIWSANPAGTLRVYVDGSEKPELEVPMADLLGGKFPNLPKPLAGEYSKGWNLYFPIPYSRSCKITSDKGDFYYHVNYRTYAKGTGVESFSVPQLQGLNKKVQALAKSIEHPRLVPSALPSETFPLSVELAPGQSASREFTGPAAITRSLTKVSASNVEAALRGVILKVSFDGEDCVEVPLGDFFGSAPGINPFETLPLGVTADGEMYCHWVMPFKRIAVLEVVNLTDQDVTLTGEMSMAEYQWTPRSMHFHAGWRTEFEVPTRPMVDWNYLTAKGQGVFAGVSFAIDNPVRQWWGEGDEKIYVDGEKFPSHFGTGTEDYFGYAWCWPGLFTHAYHAQPRCDGPGNFGRTSVNRFHILDRIPFDKSFKFDMELWHWHESSKVNMAVAAYWYARPGGTAAFKPIQAEDARVRPLAPYQVPKVAGALEGESLRIVSVEGGAEPQEWDGLSGEKHLWWNREVKPGATMTLAFDAPSTGKYRIFARFMTARDYGIHQLRINGTPAGEPMDFYNPDVKATKELQIGTFDLKAGENLLTIKAVGENRKAVPQRMFGLDYILLRK